MSVTDSTTVTTPPPRSGSRQRPELTERANTITERELAIYTERTRGSQVATERARKVLPGGVPSSFQAYDPHPIVVKHASGSRIDRRRRQRVRRLRHGLRRAVRRAHASRGAPCRGGAARRRHALRHAVRARRRRGRAARRALRPADVAPDQLGHGSDDGRHPPRPGRHQAGEVGEGRGRLPRPPRRGDDLEQAAARQGGSGRRPELGAAVRRDHAGDDRRRDRHPVQRRRRARTGVAVRRRRGVHRRTGDGEHRDLPAAAGLSRSGPRDHRRATARC